MVQFIEENDLGNTIQLQEDYKRYYPFGRLPLLFLVLPVLTVKVLPDWKHTMMNICQVPQVVW
ncbi:MAG: hypothetical protein ACLSCV_02195 [Acutalibacteraceae bacterium]